MAQFEDLYKFTITGNYGLELERLRKRLDQTRTDWKKLKDTFGKGATFFDATRDTKDLSDAQLRLHKTTRQVAGAERELGTESDTLAGALNKLTRQQNQLTVDRKAELIALEQAKREAEPRIIQLRAEVSALRRLTTLIEKRAADERFAQLAQAAGIDISKKAKAAFNAEAEAIRRATRAREKLAVVQELNKLGLDAQGNGQLQGPPLPPDIARAQKAQAEALALEEKAVARVKREYDELTIAKRLAEQGYNSRGQAQLQGPPLPPELARSQAAQLALQKDIERLRLQDETLRLKSVSAEHKKLTESIAKTRNEMAGLIPTGEKTQSTFNRIGFTFRRLIGIMAAFTIARTVVSQFNSMVLTAIRFNSEIERTKVGISGLIAAGAEVRGPLGEGLSLDDQLLRSQDIAIDQMAKLRVEALRTAASYEDLSFAFQTAIAPGLQAGLTVDQIRKVTVDISQAATGLGVAQNQLAEEIRSLVQGTITPKNTRVATALGISNADIRRAQEVGNLFEFLQKRFEAISATGVRLMDTFSAQISNAADAFKQLLEKSSKPLFLQLKSGVQQFQKAIFSLNSEKLVFQPKAVKAFEGLFKGLAKGAEGISSAFEKLSSQGVADTFGLIGEAIGLAATVTANLFKVAFNLATPVLGVFNSILGAVNSISTALSKVSEGVLGKLFVNIGRIVAVIFSWNTAVSLAKKGWTAIADRVKEVNRLSRLTNIEMAATNVKLKGISGLVTKISVLFRRLLLPVVLVAGAILAIDAALSFAGSEFSLFDKISEGFGYLNQKLDELLTGTATGKEALDEMSDPERFGQLLNRFNDIKSEIDQLGDSIDERVITSLLELDSTIKGLNAPSNVQQQLAAQAKAYTELTKASKKAQIAIRAQESQNKRARTRIDDISPQTDSQVTTLLGINKQIEDYQLKLEEAQKTLSVLRVLAIGRSPSQEPTLFGNLKESEAEVAGISDKISSLRRTEAAATDLLVGLSKERDALTGSIVAGEESISSLQTKLQGLRARSNKELDIELRKVNAIGLLEQRRARAQEDSTLINARADRAASLFAATERVALARADAAVTQQKSDLALQRLEILSGIENIGDIINAKIAAGADKELIDSLIKQKDGYSDQLEFIEQIAKIREATLASEREIARVRAEGTFNEGFGLGLQGFKAENSSIARIGEDFAKTAADGLASFGANALAQSVAAAFDPERNFDLREAAGNFLLQLGTGLLTDYFKTLLAGLITESAAGVLGDGAGAASSAAVAEANAVTIADGGAAAAGQMTFGASTAATTLTNAGIAVATAMINGANTAATRLEAAGLTTTIAGAGGSARGGAVNKLKMIPGAFSAAHLKAPGFAQGGRPAGLDPRDTIPAWLRPGEWVIRPESVSKYGDGLFDMLNRGQINPALLRSLSAGAPVVKPSRAPSGFATGGNAPGSSRSRSRGPAQVYQFHDEQTLDRALAAGDNSMVRFTRRRRSAFRAALGLEAGS